MSSDHPYRVLPIPPGAPFELRPSPGKGWGAFATKSIKKGDVMLSEDALFVVNKNHPDITAMDIFRAMRQLSPRQSKQVSYLRDNGSRPFTDIGSVFSENCFNMETETFAYSSVPTEAHGLFPLMSRFNHSCLPNAKVSVSRVGTPAANNNISMLATRDIAPGEEIKFCYKSVFSGMTALERRIELRFKCNCLACVPGTAFQRLSDARRRLYRGVEFLTHGFDKYADKYAKTPGSPIIMNPEVRKAAENSDIPMPSRLVHFLLGIFLLKEEGLIGYETQEKAVSLVMQLTPSFKTERNARIGKLVMEQDDLLGKICVAFGIYGQADASDEEAAMELRAHLRGA